MASSEKNTDAASATVPSRDTVRLLPAESSRLQEAPVRPDETRRRSDRPEGWSESHATWLGASQQRFIDPGRRRLYGAALYTLAGLLAVTAFSAYKAAPRPSPYSDPIMEEYDARRAAQWRLDHKGHVFLETFLLPLSAVALGLGAVGLLYNVVGASWKRPLSRGGAFGLALTGFGLAAAATLMHKGPAGVWWPMVAGLAMVLVSGWGLADFTRRANLARYGEEPDYEEFAADAADAGMVGGLAWCALGVAATLFYALIRMV